MITDRIDRAWNARYFSGEPIAIDYVPLTADGLIEDLADRRFTLLIRRVDNSVVDSVAGVIVSGADARVALRLSGNATIDLAGVPGLRWQITEKLIDGQDVIAEGKLLVYPAAQAGDDAEAGAINEGPVTVLKNIINRPRIVSSQRGARGAAGASGTGVSFLQFGGDSSPDADNTVAFAMASASPEPVVLPPGDWRTTVAPAGEYLGRGRIVIISTGEVIQLDATPQRVNIPLSSDGRRLLNYRLAPGAGASWTANAKSCLAIGLNAQNKNRDGLRSSTVGCLSAELTEYLSECTYYGNATGRCGKWGDRQTFISSNAGKWVGCDDPIGTGHDFWDPGWDKRQEFKDLYPAWLTEVTTDGLITGPIRPDRLPAGFADAQLNCIVGRDGGNHAVTLSHSTIVGEHGAKGWWNRYLALVGYATAGHSLTNWYTAALGALALNSKMTGDYDIANGFACATALVHGGENEFSGAMALPKFDGWSKIKATVDVRVQGNRLSGTFGFLELRTGSFNDVSGYRAAPDMVQMESCTGRGVQIWQGVFAAYRCGAYGPRAGKNNRSFAGIGSINGTTLTMEAVGQGTLRPGDPIGGPDVVADQRIVTAPPGGGVGDYTVSIAQTAATNSIVGGLENAVSFHASGNQRSNTMRFGSGHENATFSGKLAATKRLITRPEAVGKTLGVDDLVGAIMTRTGPLADFTDVTPDAAAIVAALDAYEIDQGADWCIKNATGAVMTVAPGAGVNVQGGGAYTIAPNSVRNLRVHAKNVTPGAEQVTLVPLDTAPATGPVPGRLVPIAAKGGDGAGGPIAKITGVAGVPTLAATVNLPGLSLGNNGYMKLVTVWTHTPNANSKPISVQFGGLGNGGAVYSQVDGKNQARTVIETVIQSYGSLTSQMSHGNQGALNPIGQGAALPVRSTINTATVTPISLIAQLAVATDEVNLEAYFLEAAYMS